MANYFLTNKAVEDLSEIWNYTFEVWSENQADKYYALLLQTCREVSNKPSIGKNYPEISNEILGLHVGKHIIFYRIVKPKEIEVMRILHGKMDLKKQDIVGTCLEACSYIKIIYANAAIIFNKLPC